MSSFYRLGFANNNIRSVNESERKKLRDQKPPSYESCCAGVPNLPTYSEAMAEYYIAAPRGLILNQENVNHNLLYLGPRPEFLTCPSCLLKVQTLVVRVPMPKINFRKLFMYMFCCFLPFFCDCSGRQMKKHYCPKCLNLIGIYKRSRRQQ